MDQEKLIKMFHGQARSADLWIEQWRLYKDVSSVRNAALAIGKMAGIYAVLHADAGNENENLPEDVIQKMDEYHKVWDDLRISREIAKAISIHG